MKRIIALLGLAVLLAFSGCEAEQVKTPPASQGMTDLPPQSVGGVTVTPVTPEVTPTLSPTPSDTKVTPDIPGDPRYDSSDAFGPFTFGEEEYKIYFGKEGVVFFTTDKQEYCTFEGMLPKNRELFMLSASFIDLDFDGKGDFSYLEEDGRRICFLWTDKDQDGGFRYCEQLSELYGLTRCYETGELYGRLTQESNEYYSFTFSRQTGELQRSQDTVSAFSWDITSLAEALVGEGATVEEGEGVIIRRSECKSYTVGGHITVAVDENGAFYIKDMPHKGFCRVSLNPNGRWSKSEKVMPDSL